MISYSWQQQDIALKLYNNLAENDVMVFIDNYNMTSENNVAQAIGETIEQASVLLIGLSDDYQKSIYCRQEALYAFQLKKKLVFLELQKDFKPTGWLGFIQAEHMTYSFYDGVDFDTNFEKLLQNVEKNLVHSLAA